MADDVKLPVQRAVPPSLAVCSRCEENLHASTQESILLSCLHAFCKVCVRAGCLPRTGDGNVVECPTCKLKCQKQDIGCCLFFVNSSEPDKKEDICVACDDNLSATSLCVQCDEMICEACVQAHKRVRMTKDHTIRPLDTGGMQDARPIYCQKHANEKMRLYCELCDKISCRLCVQEHHRDHKCCFLNEAADKLRQVLKAKLKLIDGKVNTLKGANTLIDQRLKALDDTEERTCAQIKEFMVHIREDLDNLEKSLYSDLSAVVKTKRQNLQHKHDDIDNLLKRIRHCKETVDYAAESGSDTALMCTRRPFLVHLQDLVSAKCQVPNPTHVLDICFQHDPKLLAKLMEQGTILVNNQPIERTLEQRHSTAPTFTSAISDTVSNSSGKVESSLANTEADTLSAVAPSHPTANRSQGVLQTNQALLPKPSGQEKASSATAKCANLPPPPTNVIHHSGATAVSEAAMANTSQLPVAFRSDQKVAEPTTIRSANGNALKELKDMVPSPRAKKESRKERSCAITEATANDRMEGPDVCAADSSHSPRRPVQSAKQDDAISVKPPARGQLVRETEADSAVGQDSSDFDMVRITNIKSLAPSAAETADTTTNSSTTVATRRERWSPYNVANNHKPDDLNEDYCAVCHNGGELMCCDTCPKVYHVQCHVPELALPFSAEKWSCSLCVPEARTGAGGAAPSMAAAGAVTAQSEEPVTGKRKAPMGLTDVELKLCEHILLKLFCYKGSLAFHFPVQKTVPNYYKMIKEPMDFTSVKKKLLRQHFNHYMTFSEFIADINLIFANCVTYNPPGSELAIAATALHEFFVDLVRQLMPHLVDEASKLRKPEDVMHKVALKKKKCDGDPPVHIC